MTATNKQTFLLIYTVSNEYNWLDLADFLPDFITAFLLLETQSIVTVVTLRPDDQRLLHSNNTVINPAFHPHWAGTVGCVHTG